MSFHVTQDLIEAYAKSKNISFSKAEQILKDNFQKEKVAELRDMIQKSISSFREIYPKVEGVILRESDYSNGIARLNRENILRSTEIKELEDKLELYKKTFNQALAILNNIVKEDDAIRERLRKLEEKKEKSFLSRLLFWKR